jgi:hypothetical protein
MGQAGEEGVAQVLPLLAVGAGMDLLLPLEPMGFFAVL